MNLSVVREEGMREGSALKRTRWLKDHLSHGLVINQNFLRR